MKLETLDGLNDNELEAVIGRSRQLLKTRDEERKAKAIADARALLAAAGLSLKDVAAKAKNGKAKALTPQASVQYQHPTNKALVWNGKCQKPGWLLDLEKQGGKATQVPAEGGGHGG
jgi:DNA-binding protein H-NS